MESLHLSLSLSLSELALGGLFSTLRLALTQHYISCSTSFTNSTPVSPHRQKMKKKKINYVNSDFKRSQLLI